MCVSLVGLSGSVIYRNKTKSGAAELESGLYFDLQAKRSAMSDIQDWYRSIPQITRYWFTGTVVVPLAGRFGLFSPWWMVLEWTLLIHKFQARASTFRSIKRFFGGLSAR